MNSAVPQKSNVSQEPGESEKPNVLKRYALLLAGLFFVSLGAVGVVLPGIPTAGPLILASWCLTKSFPALEKRLVRNRFFAAFQQYLDGDAVMPTRARVAAIAIMWVSVGLSSFFLYRSGSPVWLPVLIILAGVVGTFFIWRFRRNQ